VHDQQPIMKIFCLFFFYFKKDEKTIQAFINLQSAL